MQDGQICQFCGVHPVAVTVTRRHKDQSEPEVLSLCHRCGYFHQVVAQVVGLEQAMPGPPCLLCGKLSAVTGEARDRQGELLGRFRLCEGCAQRQSHSLADVLRVANLWSPGVLELPPPARRVFPPPPGGQPPGRN